MKKDRAYQDYLLACQSGLPAEIVLGSPKSAECRHFGVCRIYFAGATYLMPACGDRISGYLRYDSYTGRLLIHFLRCTISAATYAKHFGDGYFRVIDSYRLDEEVARRLAFAEDRLSILPGKYPVLDDGHLLTVSVNLGAATLTAATGPEAFRSRAA